MFVMLSNLAKAAVAVAVSPIDVIVDVVTLPASAFDNTGPFDRTAKRFEQAGTALDAALKPDQE